MTIVSTGTVAECAAAVAKLLNSYRGQRYLGVVDGLDCVEIVFSERGNDPNLLCLYLEPPSVSHGGVADAEIYANKCAVKVGPRRR